jgi:hypothetical protein
MRYMFLMYSQEIAGGPPPEEIERLKRDHGAVMKEVTEKRILLAVEGLKPTTTATTVRMKEGKAITLDGPFAETKEQLAGFYILECADLDEAIEWAKRMPTGCKGGPGGIEIRPVAELPRVS